MIRYILLEFLCTVGVANATMCFQPETEFYLSCKGGGCAVKIVASYEHVDHYLCQYRLKIINPENWINETLVDALKAQGKLPSNEGLYKVSINYYYPYSSIIDSPEVFMHVLNFDQSIFIKESKKSLKSIQKQLQQQKEREYYLYKTRALDYGSFALLAIILLVSCLMYGHAIIEKKAHGQKNKKLRIAIGIQLKLFVGSLITMLSYFYYRFLIQWIFLFIVWVWIIEIAMYYSIKNKRLEN